MNRLERISAILVKLQSRPVVTAREIAAQFGVSLRTIYRDIRALEESGIPVSGEAGTGYSLVDGFKLPPLMFTTEEAISFLMAEKLIGHQTDDDTSDIFCSGMDKVRAVLKSAEKEILHNFDKHIRIVPESNIPAPKSTNVLQPLLKSIMGKCEVTIQYKAGYNHETTHRTIEPLGIFYMYHCWYLLAWCRLRHDYRTFHLHRIQRISPGEGSFQKEHPDLDVLIERVSRQDKEYPVKIRIHREALRAIGPSKYMYGFVEEEEKGEYFIQHYNIHSFEYFARWYLSFADRAEILEPEKLKETVRHLISSIRI